MIHYLKAQVEEAEMLSYKYDYFRQIQMGIHFNNFVMK